MTIAFFYHNSHSRTHCWINKLLPIFANELKGPAFINLFNYFMKSIVSLALLVMLTGLVACSKSDNTPQPVPYAEFTLKGQKQNFHSSAPFTKNQCSTSDYCGEFYYDSDAQEINLLKFGIPAPIVGKTYHSGDPGIKVSYINAEGVIYSADSGVFQVVFTDWQGAGGWVKATFSGWMKSQGDSIEFQSGYFQGRIAAN